MGKCEHLCLYVSVHTLRFYGMIKELVVPYRSSLLQHVAVKSDGGYDK